MIDTLALLLSAAKTAYDSVANKTDRNEAKYAARKADVASLYLEIAATIQEAARVFAQGEIPHGSCGKMLLFAQDFSARVGDFLGAETAEAMAHQLREAYQIENLLRDTAQEDAVGRKARIGKMQEAAGYFEAAAALLKAGR